MANANAIRQSMIDSQSAIDQMKGPSGGIIEDQNKKDQEALFAKWDRENMVKPGCQHEPAQRGSRGGTAWQWGLAAAEQGKLPPPFAVGRTSPANLSGCDTAVANQRSRRTA